MIAGLIVSGSQQEELQERSFGSRFNCRFTGLRLNRQIREFCQFSRMVRPTGFEPVAPRLGIRARL